MYLSDCALSYGEKIEPLSFPSLGICKNTRGEPIIEKLSYRDRSWLHKEFKVGKKSYYGGSSIVNTGVGHVSRGSSNLSPEPNAGATVKKLQSRAKLADETIKKIENKIVRAKQNIAALRDDLRRAEETRQNVHARIKSKQRER